MTPHLSMFSLSGLTVVVAGASRGIGYGLSYGLAQAGGSVIGFGRSSEVNSDCFTYRECDITDAFATECLLNSIEKDYGGIDVYVHVAGITLPSDLGLQTPKMFADTIESNLTSAYRCCSYVGKSMAERRRGSIIIVTSIGSLLAFPDNPGYVASKGGLRMMSKALAFDLGPSNVRVNNLVPGYIHTDMTEVSYSDLSRNKERAQRTMLGRWGQVDDLIGAAIFLSSPASSYITATDLIVDGGWTSKGL